MSRNTITQKKPIQKENIGSVNKTLLYIFIGLTILGIVMVFDASVYKASEVFGDPFYFLRQHIIWIIIGSIAGIVMYLINYKILAKLSPIFLIGTIVLLALVIFAGNEINGAKRWFEIAGIPIQPAEFAKLTTIIYISSLLSKERTQRGYTTEILRKAFISRLITFISVLILILILVMLEPDMGTTMVIAISSFLVFFISGEDKIHTIGSIMVAGAMGFVGLLAGLLESYRMARIQTFLHLIFKGEVDNPTKDGYQIQQILIGIGSSGFWGKGFGQSRQRFGYLVENTAFTDSIFAVVLEELGFASALILVGVWSVILWQGLKISSNIEDKFGKLLVAGIIIWLCSQAFLNMAANVALIPLTGIPLPLFTYGGSNTIVTLAGIGLLLNVSRYAKNTK